MSSGPKQFVRVQCMMAATVNAVSSWLLIHSQFFELLAGLFLVHLGVQEMFASSGANRRHLAAALNRTRILVKWRSIAQGNRFFIVPPFVV